MLSAKPACSWHTERPARPGHHQDQRDLGFQEPNSGKRATLVVWTGCKSSRLDTLYGMSSQVGKDIELDAVGRQFEPYLTAGCVCMLAAPLRGLGCCPEQAWSLYTAACMYWEGHSCCQEDDWPCSLRIAGTQHTSNRVVLSRQDFLHSMAPGYKRPDRLGIGIFSLLRLSTRLPLRFDYHGIRSITPNR